jgi:hypothetical protein
MANEHYIFRPDWPSSGAKAIATATGSFVSWFSAAAMHVFMFTVWSAEVISFFCGLPVLVVLDGPPGKVHMMQETITYNTATHWNSRQMRPTKP